MAPIFVAVALFAAFCWVTTGQFEFGLMPIGLIPIWLGLRLTTPRSGMFVPTIGAACAKPGMSVMLSFCGAAIALQIVLVIVDIVVFDHPFGAPLEMYHIALFSPAFVIMIVGALRAGRLMDERKATGATYTEGQDENRGNNC